jgi:hypothetical protein
LNEVNAEPIPLRAEAMEQKKKGAPPKRSALLSPQESPEIYER